MSIETWCFEFYPVPACYCLECDAIDHSIQKWTGLLLENLKKHGVVLEANTLWDQEDNSLRIHGCDTCSLCEHYLDRRSRGCEACPLCKVRDNVPCDEARSDEQAGPYYMRHTDPSIMLGWLKKTKEYFEC